MTFLGLEQPVAYGRELVFDPTTASMVLQALNAYINAARDEYLRGILEMKDFNKEYGDFLSPILKDMAWYEKNVTGDIRNFINDLYAHGIDPLRSAEGRAAVSRKLANMPTKGIANVRLSAKTAELFLLAEQELRRKGLYDPILSEYEGTPLSEYSTMGDKDDGIEAMGVWDRTSPTPIHDLATFGNPYFEGMKPNIHKRSKNGVAYSEESITMDDLKAIADSKYNELVRTPLGQLMYKYYKDITGSDEEAREMFNLAIANAQQRRTYIKDDYEDNYLKRRLIALQELSNALARDKFNWEKLKYQYEHGGSGEGLNPGDDGFSWVGRTYEDFVANAASDGVTNYNWYDVLKNYDSINKTIGQTQIDFGKQFVGKYNITKEQADKLKLDLSKLLLYGNISQYQYLNKINEIDTSVGGYDSIKQAYQNRFSRKIDPGTFVAWHGGETLSDNKNVIVASAYDLDRLYDEDDVITNTMGYTKKHRGNNNDLRNTFKLDSNGDPKDTNGITISPTGVGYGAISKKDGAFHVYVEVIVKDSDNTKTCYYDMGVKSPGRKAGAWLKDIKDRQIVSQSGSLIGKRTPFSGTSLGFVPEGNLQFNYNWNVPGEEFNMYPDYSLWGDYGPGDVRANAYLKAKATENNAGY